MNESYRRFVEAQPILRLRTLIHVFANEIWSGQRLAPLFAAVLAIFFVARYLAIGDLPGNSEHPLGWWGWWDQSQYLKSAAAFAVGDLDPAQHWYPLGYPLLGAIFFKTMPMHAFFFINLAAFITFGLLLIALARRLGLGCWTGAVAMLIGAALPSILAEQYVIPWTTTPVATLYAGFFLVYSYVVIDGISPGRLAIMAALAATVVVIRPVDILALSPALLHIAYRLVHLYLDVGQDQRALACKSTAVGLAAGVGVLGLSILLHIAIYGFHLSEYMKASSRLGLDLSIIPFRYFMIFSDPRDFFGSGVGILDRYPLAGIGLFGLVYATLFWRRFFGITAAVWLTFGLYLAYVDFLPSGIWTYKNIHYLKWTFPFLALLAFVAIDHIFRGKQIAKSLVAALVTLPLVTLGLSAEKQPSRSIKVVGERELLFSTPDSAFIAAIQFEGLGGDHHAIYFGHHTMEIDGVLLQHIRDFRLIPNNNSVYLVFNRPRFVQLMKLTLAVGVAVGENPIATPLQPRWSLKNPFHASVDFYSVGYKV